MKRLTAMAAALIWLAVATLAAADEFRNEIGMTFKLLPAGTFLMGSPADEPARESDETQHLVTLSRPFYMQSTEVTQGQWQEVMGNNPAHWDKCGADCPVENVSWPEVQDFIKALNRRTGSNYRLPSEAEFEYAARAGSVTAIANGQITETACGYDPALDAIGWYCYNAGEMPQPVAKKQANAWGLYDMHGNLWEWCADSWDGAPYAAGPVVDPLSPQRQRQPGYPERQLGHRCVVCPLCQPRLVQTALPQRFPWFSTCFAYRKLQPIRNDEAMTTE